jgi:rhomboid protease GluP
MTFSGQTPSSSQEPATSQPPVQPQPIPVRWDLPARIPTVTYAILGITALFYLLQVISQSLFGTISGLDPLSFFGAKINEFIKMGELWRLFTPLLLHGSVIHILFNMYALFIIGRGLEQQYGHERFLELYLISGFAGNVVSFLFSPNPSIGASTAIFGLISAQTIFIFQNRDLYGKRANQMLLNNLFIIVVNIALGLYGGLSIDIFGHLGGLLGGLIFAWFGGPIWKMEPVLFEPTLRNIRSQSQARKVLFFVFLLFSLFTVVGFYK